MIELNDKINLDIFEKIIFDDKKIEISENVKNNVKQSFEFLKTFSKNKIIYGVNTGFGPMAQYKISSKDQKKLQLNLIRSHSAGTGNIIDKKYIKAAVLARLNTLSQGYSGINYQAIEMLKQFINNDINPVIYEHGGVGASGDLVQLSHLALSLIGEGEVIYKNKIKKTKDVLTELKIKPLKIHIREGLSLINGTSVMTGIGLVNIIYAKRLVDWSIIASAIINDIVGSYSDPFSYNLNKVKLHKGQKTIADKLNNFLIDSKRIKDRNKELYKKEINKNFLKEKVQEYYSLRCVPQIIGPIIETIENAEKILINEINSVNDNPIIDAENKNVYHGGNFHGDYVSLEMDKLKIAITKLSMLAERQINYLMNDKLNNILPPFINLGKLGLNLGMQGVQFTATSTVAENQTISNPMYIHSIPNNNDNQDIVSMGTNSALLTKKIIENTFEVMSIELISLVQAIDYIKDKKTFSKKTINIYNKIRKIVPTFVDDTIKYNDIKNVIKLIKS